MFRKGGRLKWRYSERVVSRRDAAIIRRQDAVMRSEKNSIDQPEKESIIGADAVSETVDPEEPKSTLSDVFRKAKDEARKKY